MFKRFKSKPDDVHIEGLGAFRYFEDEVDKYWELTSVFGDPANAIRLDFCAVDGDSNGTKETAKDALLALLNDPTALWSLVDHKVVEAVKGGASEINEANFKEHFFVKTLTVSDFGFFEVGFHSKSKDVFLELFVRQGVVTDMDRDYGCCAQ
ncbi:MAG: hypothetical protein AAGL69_07155 [Pseudomonadota bacterium]